MNTLTASAAIQAGKVQQVTDRRRSLTTARFRVLWVALAFALVGMVGVLRIFSFGFSDTGVSRTSLEEALLPERGEITDRNGQPLARVFPAYALWYNPKALKDGGAPLVSEPGEVAAKLKAIFPTLNTAKVAKQLSSGKAG
ncbi:MAG: hypothetical protein ABJJ48_10695, partial [Marinomonas sp.]